jgi:hypothetical protein
VRDTLEALPKGVPDQVPTPLVVFDGVCNLCSWSVQFLAPATVTVDVNVDLPIFGRLVRYWGAMGLPGAGDRG